MPGSLPPASAFLGVYGLLGTAVSFGLGRAPGSLPADPVPELWLSVVAVCVFLVYYSIVDVYAVARVKQKVSAIYKRTPCRSAALIPIRRCYGPRVAVRRSIHDLFAASSVHGQ
jgi:hypothetical protein